MTMIKEYGTVHYIKDITGKYTFLYSFYSWYKVFPSKNLKVGKVYSASTQRCPRQKIYKKWQKIYNTVWFTELRAGHYISCHCTFKDIECLWLLNAKWSFADYRRPGEYDGVPDGG